MAASSKLFSQPPESLLESSFKTRGKLSSQGTNASQAAVHQGFLGG